MDTEQRIKQVAAEAIEKIRAIAAEKDEWPKIRDMYLFLSGSGSIDLATWGLGMYDQDRKARRRIAPDTPEGRARLERLAEWEVFFVDFMTAGDAEGGDEIAYFAEIHASHRSLHTFFGKAGTVGQRGFTTEAKRGEWIHKWGRDYVEKMLKGGMP